MKEINFLQVKVQSVEEVIEYVQNIMLHRYWLWAYGLESLDSFDLMSERNLERKIQYLINKGYTKVSDPVAREDKLVGICRDFCLLSKEILRFNNIEARARCGFSSYLDKGKYIDHWIVEYRDEGGILKTFDPQIDLVQSEKLNIRYPMLDIKSSEFILASDAWIKCRNKELDAQLFGIRDWWGFEYLRLNLILDANSLLGYVMYPWDLWPGYMSKSITDFSEYDYEVFDELALIINRGDLKELEEYLKKHSIIVTKDKSLISRQEEV